ncbi:MAG: MATE family efflux transporter [Saprospiraceae bacterium]|nr:MATE family efflux transporter [Saprospiraceae bacterium]
MSKKLVLLHLQMILLSDICRINFTWMSVFSYSEIRPVLQLAWPIIIGNLSQILLNLIDSMIVGQLGYRELAASGLINSVLSLPMVSCMGLSVALAPMMADLASRNQLLKGRQVLQSAGLSVLTLTGLVVAFLFYFEFLLYRLGQEKEIVDIGKPFFFWMCWSLMPMMGFFILKQFYDGLGMVRIPMTIALLSIAINTILNIALVFGKWGFPKMGLEGSGLATFITRFLIFAGLLIHLIYTPKFKVYQLFKFDINRSSMYKFLKLGIPSSWQSFSEVAAFSLLAIMIGWFGAVQMAAHQIAISVATATYMISLGLSSAGSIFIGSHYRQNENSVIRYNGMLVLKLGLCYSIVAALVLAALHQWIPHLFTREQEVLQIAAQLMLLAAAFQISDAVQAIGIGILRGLQDVRIPTLITTISYWVIGIPSGYLLATLFELKAVGVWSGFVICLSISAIFLLRRFLHITKSQIHSKTI